MVDKKQLAVEHQVFKVLNSLSLLWSLKTNEGVGTHSVSSIENSAGLDFAERLEKTSKVSLTFLA